ncbi:hypothetical protein LTR37_010511 [Vermiconidia calcicola]|uniref:Uncharacterized protein n=1 Tax=Vermiconidia calcicola TaxID=1690605 RepID=A0ACC3N605_9PEZI|nr:hypothetical protein LTR37_010511 [Vermiconidia calcicola]
MAEAITGYNAYWRLHSYKSVSKHKLYEDVRRANRLVKKTANKVELVEAKHKVDKGLLCYIKCSVEELHAFAKARGILTATAKPTNASMSRRSFIQLLKAADNTPTFKRFLALPPELRNRVYEYYMCSFSKRLRTPSAPPLAQTCKQLRSEVLPMFYSQHAPVLKLERLTRHGHFLLDNNTAVFLDSLSSNDIAAMRSIHFRLQDTRRHKRTHLSSFSVDLDSSSKLLAYNKREWESLVSKNHELFVQVQEVLDQVGKIERRKRFTLEVVEALRAAVSLALR